MKLDKARALLFLVIYASALVAFYSLFGTLWLAMLISIPWSAAGVRVLENYFFTRKD